MKSNEEFIRGIYVKAELLEIQNKKPEKNFNRYIKIASIAAIVVLMPLLALNSGIFKKEDLPNLAAVPRTLSLGDTQANIEDAEMIVVADIDSVKAQEDSMSMDVKVLQVLSGAVEDDKLSVELPFTTIDYEGRKKVILLLFKDYEGKFEILNGEQGILIHTQHNLYYDFFGDQYSLEEIKDIIDRRK
ncbi:MAG: hypothetical protein RBT15_01110 [Gudongella sp.]|jgi:hypothetical protein|nr:hypothetical protein [Gudongella sp.]